MEMNEEIDINITPFYETQSIAIPEPFQDFFSHFYYAANHTVHSIHKKLIPSFQTILVFNLGNKISFAFENDTYFDAPNSLILGPIKKSIEYTLSPGAEMLVANFKWDAFYRFFGQSLKSYKEFIKQPDDLVKEACFQDLWLQLRKAETLQKKVKLLLDFSLPYLRERELGSARIINGNEPDSVKKIAAESGYSERNVQLNYQKYLGFSDKELNRYQRFKKAVECLTLFNGKPESVDWLDIVTQCGYYDQSHLIHDFNFFIHLSPSRYLKLQEDICMSAL